MQGLADHIRVCLKVGYHQVLWFQSIFNFGCSKNNVWVSPDLRVV